VCPIGEKVCINEHNHEYCTPDDRCPVYCPADHVKCHDDTGEICVFGHECPAHPPAPESECDRYHREQKGQPVTYFDEMKFVVFRWEYAHACFQGQTKIRNYLTMHEYYAPPDQLPAGGHFDDQGRWIIGFEESGYENDDLLQDSFNFTMDVFSDPMYNNDPYDHIKKQATRDIMQAMVDDARIMSRGVSVDIIAKVSHTLSEIDGNEQSVLRELDGYAKKFLQDALNSDILKLD